MGELDPTTGLPMMPKCSHCESELPDVVELDTCPACGAGLPVEEDATGGVQ